MIKVASFVKRPLTDLETQQIIRAIGSKELEIVPCKCVKYIHESMTTNLFISTPYNCDVVLLKTRPYSIPWSLSKRLKDKMVINIRRCIAKNNHLTNEEFVGLDVYKQGILIKWISFSECSKPIQKMFARLRQLRKSFKMTQKEVSKYLHISQPSYANIEQGKTSIGVDRLITLALMYNVTTDYILGLSNNPDPK